MGLPNKHPPRPSDCKFKATTHDQLLRALTWGTESFFGYLFPDSIPVSKRGRGVCVCVCPRVCRYHCVYVCACVWGGVYSWVIL